MVLLSVMTYAQTTITLKPGPVIGKDAFVHGLPSEANNNYGSNEQFCAAAWTFSGTPGVIRPLVEFPLNQVPANATILSAYLSLYAIDNSNGFGYHSGSNECWIERITTSWNESTVTWNTQPQTTTQNRTSMPASLSLTQNYLNMDVTALVTDMLANPSSSYGFMLKIKTESSFRRLNFCSSDHANEAKHPELTITYTLEPVTDTCLTLRPGASEGIDAFIHGLSSLSATNFGTNEQLCAAAWTFTPDPGVIRTLINFSLPGLPPNAVITTAELSLYAIDNENGFGYHSTLTGSNEAWVERVTSSWTESAVTWNNQPSTTTTNRVALPASQAPNEDYLDINVTQLVKDMYLDPQNSHGFMVKLQDENYFRRLNFCSSDHADSQKHPKLVVCYRIGSAIEAAPESSVTISLFPNPTHGMVTLDIQGATTDDTYQMKIMNLNGQTVYTRQVYNGENRLSVEALSSGVYMIQLRTPTGFFYTKRLVVQ